MNKKLTPKQERFVEEYLVDFNATQACIRAGYSEKTAYRIGAELLHKTSVSEAINERRQKLTKKTELTIEKVREMMLELYKTSSQKIPLLDREGSQVFDAHGKPVYKVLDANACSKAVDMLAKHMGAYEADNKRELLGSLDFIWSAPKAEGK